MEKKINYCKVTAGGWCREYDVTTTSALKAAQWYGGRQAGEMVEVYSPSGKLLSRALYTPNNGGYYYRVNI